MKTLKLFASATLTLALACASLVGIAGCASASRNTLVASTATHATAATGIRAWNERIKQTQKEVDALAVTDPVKAHNLAAKTTNEIAQVRVAYERYQASQIAVINAAQALSRIPSGDTNAPVAHDRLTKAIERSSILLGEIIALLEKFGVIK